MDSFLLDKQLRNFLQEDLEHGDITTNAIFADQETATVVLQAREPLIATGIEQVAARVFRLLDERITYSQPIADGQRVDSDDVLMTINGPVHSLLRGERVALNLLQRMSGIATLTRGIALVWLAVPIAIWLAAVRPLRVVARRAARLRG